MKIFEILKRTLSKKEGVISALFMIIGIVLLFIYDSTGSTDITFLMIAGMVLAFFGGQSFVNELSKTMNEMEGKK